MKSRTLCIIFCAEALACALLASPAVTGGGSLAGIMAFPTEQLGDFLRAMSLSGAAGNAAALALYCAICLIPAAYLAARALKGRARAEDALLALLSILLFAVLYMMINPASIARHFGAYELVAANKAMLGATVYATAAAYFVLRVLRGFSRGGTDSLLRHLRYLLYAICALLVFAVSGAGRLELEAAFSQLRAGNTGMEDGLALSYAFLLLQFIVDVLPYVFNIVIIFAALALVHALEEGQYGGGVAPAAKQMALICRIAVITIMLSQVAVNTLQLLLGSLVRASHYTLSIPLMPIVFVLAAMLLAHYFEQSRALKDDNDMFI